MRSFRVKSFSTFILAFIIFLLINIISIPGAYSPPAPKPIDLSSTNKQLDVMGKTTSWWLAKAYFTEPKPPEVIVLGTSQAGCILNADAYVYDRRVDVTGDHRCYTVEHDLKKLTHKDWRVQVLAFPGAMISDQLIICRSLFSAKYHPKMVILTLAPRDFIDNNYLGPTSSEAFSFFSKSITVDSEIRPIFVPQFRTFHDFISVIPVRTVTRNLLDIEDYNLSRSNERTTPLPLQALILPFERARPRQTVVGSGDLYYFMDNLRDYKKRYKNPFPEYLNTQLHCLDILFRDLAQQGISIAVVEMPLALANHLLPKVSGFYRQKSW